MTRENDDYDSDIRFGEWLRNARTRAELTLETAAQASTIPLERLKALELGYSDRGITRDEASRLAQAYRVPLEDVLHEATRP
jgi:transcriptional regulator with XRE-family HTH domain